MNHHLHVYFGLFMVFHASVVLTVMSWCTLLIMMDDLSGSVVLGSVVGPVHDSVHDWVHGLVLGLFCLYPGILEEVLFISGWIA